ncbi:hypothetical protein CB1_000237011 [Camelus ferus]|nr:hypothetical protein CB1_000237011 [Camelus ferus]
MSRGFLQAFDASGLSGSCHHSMASSGLSTVRIREIMQRNKENIPGVPGTALLAPGANRGKTESGGALVPSCLHSCILGFFQPERMLFDIQIRTETCSLAGPRARDRGCTWGGHVASRGASPSFALSSNLSQLVFADI